MFKTRKEAQSVAFDIKDLLIKSLYSVRVNGKIDVSVIPRINTFHDTDLVKIADYRRSKHRKYFVWLCEKQIILTIY